MARVRESKCGELLIIMCTNGRWKQTGEKAANPGQGPCQCGVLARARTGILWFFSITYHRQNYQSRIFSVMGKTKE